MKDDLATTKHPKSALAEAQEQHEEEFEFFDISGVTGLGNKVIERIAIKRGKGRDFENAVLAAHKYAAEQTKRAGEGAQAAAADFDFMGDAKLRQILFRLCFAVDPKDPDKLARLASGKGCYPAFPSPEWICDNLHTDQVASIMRLVGEVRRHKAPRPEGMGPNDDPLGLDDDSMERLIDLLSSQLGTNIPERILKDLDREYLTHFVVIVADRLVDARKARDALLEERAELEKTVAELRAELEERSAAPDETTSQE